MADENVMGHIEALVKEEHELLKREEADAIDAEALESDRERLEQVQIELDRCWDLLRQRRARRAAGGDPDEAQLREAKTVEHYQQ